MFSHLSQIFTLALRKKRRCIALPLFSLLSPFIGGWGHAAALPNTQLSQQEHDYQRLATPAPSDQEGDILVCKNGTYQKAYARLKSQKLAIYTQNPWSPSAEAIDIIDLNQTNFIAPVSLLKTPSTVDLLPHIAQMTNGYSGPLLFISGASPYRFNGPLRDHSQLYAPLAPDTFIFKLPSEKDLTQWLITLRLATKSYYNFNPQACALQRISQEKATQTTQKTPIEFLFRINKVKMTPKKLYCFFPNKKNMSYRILVQILERHFCSHLLIVRKNGGKVFELNRSSDIAFLDAKDRAFSLLLSNEPSILKTRDMTLLSGEKIQLLGGMVHRFSSLRLGENSLLTVSPWSLKNPYGGKLNIICLGDCILDKNAHIDISEKGYPGGGARDLRGFGPGGGESGYNCAGGGSYATKGGTGTCKEFPSKEIHTASGGPIYGSPLLDDDISLGSGGGTIYYQQGGIGIGGRGGGSLSLHVGGQLIIESGASIIADGEKTTWEKGGAGSGGSIFINVEGSIILGYSQIHIKAQGGHVIVGPPSKPAHGQGGDGRILIHGYLQKQALHVVPQATILSQSPEEKRQSNSILSNWTRATGTPPLPKNLQQLIIIYSKGEQRLSSYPPPLPPAKPPYDIHISYFFHKKQGIVSLQQGDNSAAIDHLQKARQLSIQAYGADDFRTEYLLENVATAYYQNQNAPQAIQLFKKTIEMHTERNGKDMKVADLFKKLGDAYRQKGNTDRAIESFHASLELHRQFCGPHDTKTIELIEKIGTAYCEINHFNQAETMLTRAMDLREATKNRNVGALADAYYSLAMVLYHKRDLGRAKTLFEKALSMRIKHYGHTTSPVASIYNGIAMIHYQKANFDEAITYTGRSLHILLHLHGEVHPKVVTLYRNLALAYQKKGTPEKAIKLFQLVLNICTKLYDSQNPQMVTCYNDLAIAYRQNGNTENAIDAWRKACRLAETLYGATNPELAIFYHSLAIALSEKSEKGAIKEAIHWFLRTLRILDRNIHQTRRFLKADTCYHLGELYCRDNDPTNGTQYFIKSYQLFAEISLEEVVGKQ